jgi:glycosyltransferase involved in cell wall biosynthesis
MSTRRAQATIDGLSTSDAIDVVFVSTSPLSGAYPGGFACRHRDFASAVARERRTHVLYLVPPTVPPAVFDDFPPPASVGATTVRVDDDGRHPLLPRHCVGRGLRWPGRNLVVPLTPNVAQLALSAPRATVVLEEAWERALPASPRGRLERARCRRVYGGLRRAGHPIVAITEREAAHLGRHLPNPVTVIPYGVDPTWFADRRDCGRGVDVLVIGAVNRDEQQVEGLVRALRANAATRTATCAIAGAEPRAAIAALADEHTFVLGYVADVRAHLAAARVVAIPTFTDVGIKTTMLRAWATGTPVVAGRAVVGAVRDGERGAVGVASLPDMADAVAGLLADHRRAEALGAAGRDLAARGFDAERSARAFAALVAATLERT